VIWVKREPEYFCEGGWTGESVICLTAKSTDRWDGFCTPSQLD
jgi:hypothetical protein